MYGHNASQVSTKKRDLVNFWWDRQYFCLIIKQKAGWLVGMLWTRQSATLHVLSWVSLICCFSFVLPFIPHLWFISTAAFVALLYQALILDHFPSPAMYAHTPNSSRQTGGMRKLNFPQVTELYFLWVTNWNSLACVTLVYVPHIFHAIGNQFTLVYFYCLTPLFPRGHLCTKVTWLTDRYYCRPRTLLVSMATSLTNLQTSI